MVEKTGTGYQIDGYRIDGYRIDGYHYTKNSLIIDL